MEAVFSVLNGGVIKYRVSRINEQKVSNRKALEHWYRHLHTIQQKPPGNAPGIKALSWRV